MSIRNAYDGGIKHKPFHGTFKIGTKYRYSSGKLHAAYDYLCPMGTALYAVRNGVILDCQDGASSNSSDTNYTNEPSNWILLGYLNKKGAKRTVYYQHLSKGLLVKKGDKVKAGQKIGYTGNSGNSTGPHLHIHAMKGWRTRAERYWNSKADYRIYPPSLVWNKDSR